MNMKVKIMSMPHMGNHIVMNPIPVLERRMNLPMMPGQDVQGCINQCFQLANQLRSMANTGPNQKFNDLLLEGAHHIDLCVTECGFAVQRAKQAVGMKVTV